MLEKKPDSETDLSLELIRCIREGDQTAWERLYLRYRDRLLFSIRCRLGPGLRSHLQTEDIFHSVVKDVMKDLLSFEPKGPGSLEHYLHACVLNKIRNKAHYFSALKRGGTVPLSDSIMEKIPNPGDSKPGYIDAARYEKLEKSLSLLPENMREVVLLRRIENISNRETARLLGKTPEAASKLYNRALARLGSLMGGVEAEND